MIIILLIASGILGASELSGQSKPSEDLMLVSTMMPGPKFIPPQTVLIEPAVHAVVLNQEEK